ncbi:hypothetical protein B5M09_010671 [Aphanomyces astaci]|uniref:RUN domain-containing protein n=1 Tax=Aphanomyces astaci TaxID=112090 RepID=A0A3R8D4H7_APHAT|nr:hypothetical protein B5M09_010671 [Aphanomyces astaci]
MSALTIPRGEHCDVVVAAEDGMAIVWQFYVQALDVGFRVLVDGVESPTFSKRIDTLDGMVDGTLEHCGDARLVCLQWDNSYSRLRAKDVLYRVMSVPTATLHVAREAANEYQIKYNHPVHNSSSTRHLDRPSTIMPSLPEGHDTSSMHDALAQRLERAVADTVAVFMTQPDTPLHAGSARPLILALEAILRHGVKPTSKMASCPPEEFYFGFLVETRNVLRDDAGVVSDAELFAPPLFMRYLGWGRARAYLCFALNRHMLHRALEVAVFNLIKRRSVVARYYDPSRALLAHYDTAQRTLACLTALYGVSFNLTPLQDDFASTAATFPPNLYQSHASDAFVTSRQLLSIGGDVAFYQGTTTHMDEFKAIQDCTPARYLCLATPPVQVTIPRGSRVCIPLHMDDPTTLVAVVQFQVTRHSIGVGFTTNPIKELVDPLQPVEGDAWVELTLRLERPIPQLQLVLDNSHSMAAQSSREDGRRTDNPALDALRRNATYDKYFKMVSFGVPASAVGQKMQQDYIPPDVATIWSRVTDKRRHAPVTLSGADMDRVIACFGEATSSFSQRLQTNAGQKKPQKIHSALDSRRANNIHIGLSRFKAAAGGPSALVAAVRDGRLDVLTPDVLHTLAEIGPTPVEVKRYSNFRGTKLDDAERFLVDMATVPRERGETDLFHVVDDLDMLDAAKRVSNVACVSQMANLQKQLTHLVTELDEEDTWGRIQFEKAGQTNAPRRQQRVDPVGTKPGGRGGRGGGGHDALMAMLRKRTGDPSQSKEPPANGNEKPTGQHALLFAAIRSTRHEPDEKQITGETAGSTSDGSHLVGNAANKDEKSMAAVASTDKRPPARSPSADLLAAIRNRPQTVDDADAVPPPPPDKLSPSPSAALLSAIRNRPARRRSPPPPPSPPPLAAEYQPNAFIRSMQPHVARLQHDLRLVQEKIQSMTEHWHDVATYLGESPATPSEYALGLLHRFLLDVRAAHRVLVSKGLVPSSAMGRSSHVGDRIATIYGAATVLASRRRSVEVAFPWAKAAFLQPTSVLQPGDRVVCRQFGRGILTATRYLRTLRRCLRRLWFCILRYAVGMVEVRLSFGYATLSVDHVIALDPYFEPVVPPLKSHDPVTTPLFGPGRLVRLVGESAVVQLSTLDAPVQAFFQANQVQFALNDRRK